MNRETRLELLFRQWRIRRLAETGLLALAAGLPFGFLAAACFGASPPVAILLTGIAACAVGSIRWRFAGFHRVTPRDIAFYLNRCHPSLEQSAELLLHPEAELTGLALRQRRRVEEIWPELSIALPHRMGRATFLLVISLLLCLGISSLQWPEHKPIDTSRRGTEKPSASPPAVAPLPEINQNTPVVTPPAYTGLRPFRNARPDIEAPEGSEISWELVFSSPPAGGRILTGEGRIAPLKRNARGAYTAALRLERSGFYSIEYWTPSGDTARSPYHTLISVQDAAPKIRLEGLAQYFEYPPDPGQRIAFTAYLTDDYGITGARVVATLSKGEGESVTFRDDTLRFGERFTGQRKSYALKKSIRLGDLGMAAGDELYLHLEADDNRRPSPQTAKTAKYIIAFEDPGQESVDMSGKLAVDRLPEYFRSQRQIIIDTEKLLAGKPGIDAAVFGERSNNIAIDQRLLRLRYGQFLGEEAVTRIGEGADSRAFSESGQETEEEHEEHEEGHDHDQHPSGGELSSTQALPAGLDPFMHIHDNVEEATFFDAATTAKLRAALAQMWDAELHLRLAEPEKALPFEYRALRLIKEIQQASRIYVERAGFDPPLIDVPGKRLTGDLSKVKAAELRRTRQEDDSSELERAIRILEALGRQNRPAEPAEKAALQATGNLLSAKAIEQPGGFLLPLQYLRQIIDQTAPASKQDRYIKEIIRVCWKLIPDRQQQPLKEVQRKGELKALFWKELSGGKEKDR